MALKCCPRSEAASLLAAAELEQVVTDCAQVHLAWLYIYMFMNKTRKMQKVRVKFVPSNIDLIVPSSDPSQMQQRVGEKAAAGNTKEIERLFSSTG